MKINKRIVPFTTLFFVDLNKEYVHLNQIHNWVKSDSFNPEGKVFVIDCNSLKITVFNKNGKKDVTPKKNNTLFSIYSLIFKIKPSLAIDLCDNKLSRFLQFFSRAGRKVSAKSFYSIFFSDVSFDSMSSNSLINLVPYIFNDNGKERFGFRKTKIIESIKSDCSDESSDINSIVENPIIDLGVLPGNPTGKILWIPKRTTSKGMWRDFISLTYFAQKCNCTIDVHFKNEEILKKFSCVFFIKGRKMDFDKYLKIKISPAINNIAFTNDEPNYEFFVFSFGMTPEYRSFLIQLKKIGENDRLTTISKINKGLI